jgi:hypothetical protein
LAQWHQDFYWLVCWSGKRAAEAAGLVIDNINLDEQVIHFACLKDRQLKIKYSVRDVSIDPNNFELCKRFLDEGTRLSLCTGSPINNAGKLVITGAKG